MKITSRWRDLVARWCSASVKKYFSFKSKLFLSLRENKMPDGKLFWCWCELASIACLHLLYSWSLPSILSVLYLPSPLSLRSVLHRICVQLSVSIVLQLHWNVATCPHIWTGSKHPEGQQVKSAQRFMNPKTTKLQNVCFNLWLLRSIRS